MKRNSSNMLVLAHLATLSLTLLAPRYAPGGVSRCAISRRGPITACAAIDWDAPPAMQQLDPLRSGAGDAKLLRAARAQLRLSQQHIDTLGMRVQTLPNAAAYLGWASELALGVRVQLAQLAVLSGWKGSASSLAGALMLSVPLIAIAPFGEVVHTLLSPVVRLLAMALSIADEGAILLIAAAISTVSTAAAAISGGAAIGAALSAGPRAIAAFSSMMRTDHAVRLERPTRPMRP